MYKAVKSFMGALALLFGFMGTASAGLIGDTVGIQYVGTGSTGVNTHVVGAGEEGNFFSNQYYDFDDASFTIRSVSNFCGIFSCSSSDQVTLALSSLDFGAALQNVILSTNLTGVVVDFGADYVNFTWNEQSLIAGTYLTAQFDTSSVPEPSAIVLLSFGLLGLSFAGKSRKKA